MGGLVDKPSYIIDTVWFAEKAKSVRLFHRMKFIKQSLQHLAMREIGCRFLKDLAEARN